MKLNHCHSVECAQIIVALTTKVNTYTILMKQALEALRHCDAAFDECKDYPITHDLVIEAIWALAEVAVKPEGVDNAEQ